MLASNAIPSLAMLAPTSWPSGLTRIRLSRGSTVPIDLCSDYLCPPDHGCQLDTDVSCSKLVCAVIAVKQRTRTDADHIERDFGPRVVWYATAQRESTFENLPDFGLVFVTCDLKLRINRCD